MTVNWGEVLTSVIITAILGAGGALWVVFTKAGRKFWVNLGTFVDVPRGKLDPSSERVIAVRGIRTLFIVAALGLLVALAALIFLVSSTLGAGHDGLQTGPFKVCRFTAPNLAWSDSIIMPSGASPNVCREWGVEIIKKQNGEVPDGWRWQLGCVTDKKPSWAESVGPSDVARLPKQEDNSCQWE